MTAKKSDLADIERNKARLKNSQSYRVSSRDVDFLEGYDGREVRLLSEFLKTERTLRRQNVRSTIIVFGSARILPPDVAKARLDDAERELAANPDSPTKEEDVRNAKLKVELSQYYQLARQLLKKFLRL